MRKERIKGDNENNENKKEGIGETLKKEIRIDGRKEGRIKDE